MLNWSKWGYGLASGTITGVATSGLSALGVVASNATGFANMPDLTVKQLGVIALFGGIVGAFSYLAKSPLPTENGNGTTLIAKNTADSGSPTKIITSWFILAALMIGLGGCATSLAPEGPYKGDMVTYQADLSIPLAKDVMQTFVKWEQANRVALQKWPEVKTAADYIRANAKQWVKSATVMREAYSTQPTPDNRDKLTKALAVLRTGLTESTKYLNYDTSTNR